MLFIFISFITTLTLTTLICLKISACSWGESLKEYLDKCYRNDRNQPPEPPKDYWQHKVAELPDFADSPAYQALEAWNRREAVAIYNSNGDVFYPVDLNDFRSIIEARSVGLMGEVQIMGYSLERVGQLIMLDQSDQAVKKAYAAGVPLEDIFA